MIEHIDDEYVLKKLNLTEMIYMNWLEIYHVMMMELYDVSVLFLRCLREIEKWSWILILRKNEEKSGKMAAPESAIIHYSLLVRIWQRCSVYPAD